MASQKWRALALVVYSLLTLSAAVDPSAADRVKWDTACQQKKGPEYKMVFNPDGAPSGRCTAPPKWACYFGPYIDPKTGEKGCCGKGNGTFSVDKDHPSEGGCCIAPAVFSFDNKGKKGGGCCEPPKSWHIDPFTGAGSCCADKDDTYECSCTCKENPNPTCPKWSGREAILSGKKWKLYCDLIYHGENDLGSAPAATWGECIDRCAGISNCVRAIYNPAITTCYLRTHGNNVVPTTPEGYWSAHLIEDVVAPVPSPDPIPVIPPAPIPSKCPEADNKVATVDGVEYKFYCQNGYSTECDVLASTDAKDMEDCTKQCTATPKCQGVNFIDDGNAGGCIMTSDYESPPLGGPLDVPFVCAIPTSKRL